MKLLLRGFMLVGISLVMEGQKRLLVDFKLVKAVDHQVALQVVKEVIELHQLWVTLLILLASLESLDLDLYPIPVLVVLHLLVLCLLLERYSLD